MRVHRWLLGSLTLSLVVATAACGGGGSETSSKQPTPEHTEPMAVVRIDDPTVIADSCSAYHEWSATSSPLVADLGRAGQLRQAGDLIGSRDLYVATLRQYAVQSDAAVMAVDAIGDPASDAGAIWIDALRTQLVAADALLAEVLTGAEHLDVSSADAFKAGVDALSATFLEFADGIDDPTASISQVTGGPEFVQALTADASCAALVNQF